MYHTSYVFDTEFVGEGGWEDFEKPLSQVLTDYSHWKSATTPASFPNVYNKRYFQRPGHPSNY